jgi:hypothetical protein
MENLKKIINMKKQIIYLINIVAILFFVNTTRSQTLIPGSLPSELSVSPTGAAVYTIPIELPEGRGGMTPQLALQYNSSAGDGILGKGWGLSGWSYISRVAESEYFDGTVGSVDFVNDGFTLDGMRLIKVPNSNTFRTEIDEGSRITAYGFGKKDESLTNDYFVIETKSGLKKYFGATEGSDSRQYYRVYSNHPVRWHLDKVVDLSGNMILYYYDRDPTYGEIYLSKVEYSKNENSNALNNQLYTVKFEYQNIASQAFQLSTFLNFNADVYRYDVRKRLSTIKIEYGSNELISKYLINYTTGGIFENEYLSSVKNVSGDETSCFNPISFTWNYNVADDTEQKQTLIEEYIPFPGYPNLKITADVNGDGRADIIEAEPGGNKIQVIVNNGQYGGTKYIVDNFNPTKIWAGDFDGDGKDEVIAENSNGQIGLYKLFTHGFVKIGPYLSGNISFVGDFDGDGLYDVITKEGELRKFCAGRGSIYYLLDNSNRKNLSGLDNAAYWQGYFNGSPKMGIIKVVESELKHYLITPFDASSYTLTNTFNFDLSGMPYLIDFGDFNADGKDDLLSLFWDGSNYSTKINYAFGSGFTEIAYNMDINTFWGINYRISDLNNDGLSDIVFIANQYSVGEKLIVEYKKLLKKPGISGGFLTIQDQVEVQITGGTPSFQNYYVGDFNAIAEKDLLFQFHTEFSSKQVQESEQSNTTLKRLLFYSAETKLPEDNIIAITDGMNVTNMISYDTYRIDLSLESNYSYPVVVNRNPYTIINKIYFADSKRLQTSTLLKEFKFKNLIMHNQGKGVLGCMEMEMRDVANGLISITPKLSDSSFHLPQSQRLF